jgi:hypothetical protein
MIRSTLPRKRVVGTICCLSLAEWVLFEVIRTPYRPPKDMLTFLGTEKYAVVVLMLGIALGGIAVLLWWAVRSFWSKADVMVIAGLLVVCVGLITFVVFHPGWPVTPLHLLFR